MSSSIATSLYNEYIEEPLLKSISKNIANSAQIIELEKQIKLRINEGNNRQPIESSYRKFNPIKTFENSIGVQFICSFKEIATSLITELFDYYLINLNLSKTKGLDSISDEYMRGLNALLTSLDNNRDLSFTEKSTTSIKKQEELSKCPQLFNPENSVKKYTLVTAGYSIFKAS